MPATKEDLRAADRADHQHLQCFHGRSISRKGNNDNGTAAGVSGAKSLTGNLAGRYRIRTGDYRLQFRVADGVVVIERIGHRDGFYDE